MPSLGADMDAGRVARWLVKPGDVVQRGDIVAVVETEKSTIEVEIFEAGVIEELLVPEGDEVAVGTALARIGVPEQWPPRLRRRAPAAGSGGRRRCSRGGADKPPRLARPGIVVSPVVRHLAERLGVDVHALEGSGAGGAVTRADVEHARSRTRRCATCTRPWCRPSPRAARHRRSPAPVGPARPSVVGHRSSPLARRVAAEPGSTCVASRERGRAAPSSSATCGVPS